MIKLGDRRWLSGIGRAAFHWSATRETKDGKKKTATGRVVYIHPRGRYCTLEFEVGVREPVKLREIFKLVEGEIFQ